jgi:tetratricopeptide (TPR) repeat protein
MPDNDETRAQVEELCDEAVDQYADGNYAEAIALYGKALELDPKCGDAYTGLAMCHQSKGDLEAAIEVTKRYVELAPEDLLGFTNLSMFYQKKGMIKEAEAAGAEARRLDWKRQLKEAKEKEKGGGK